MSPKENVHIFYFIHDLAPFGAERAVLHTVQHLDKHRFRTTVCSFWGEETLAGEFKSHGAEVVPLRARRFIDLFAWIKLFFLLLRRRPRIVVTTLPELGVPARIAALFIPRLAAVHTFQNPLSSETPFWRFWNTRTLRLCDAVTFSSKGIVEEVTAAVPAIKDRISVIQNSVFLREASAEDAAALKKELGVAGDEKLIGCVGRLTRQKGQDILLEAASVLAAKGIRHKLLLAGDGETLPRLEEQAKRLKIEDSVLFLGRRGDIARILAALDLYVAASRWESFNIALGEAMLSGRPCVATKISGHEDLLLDKTTGLASPAEDPAALAEAVAWTFDHPEETRKMAAAAQEAVRACFTPEKMTMKYENLFQSVADAR